MKLFIDTANIVEIKQINDLGVISGVTTNPSLIAKEGLNLNDVIIEICNIVNGPISAEVIGEKSDDMVNEARLLSKLHENIVIKVPICKEGLKAVKILANENIKTNVTLIFNPLQALMAARAGASYVSPFVGRLEDIGGSGIKLVSDIHEIFEKHNIKTEIISASIRTLDHIVECAKAGSDIATIPYKLYDQMIKHPLTDKGIVMFINDYKNSIK